MEVKFGPAILGPIATAEKVLEHYHKLGLTACSIAFTHSIYITKKEDAIEIKKLAKKFNIGLSIHAPYFINLNSAEKQKVETSKKRILKCCEIGNFLGAKEIIFHAGFYSKTEKEKTFENIKKQILELKKEIEKNNWKVELCPEITGKINVFGDIDEIKQLVVETGCGFCIDFAHILARYNDYKFEEIKQKFKDYKKWFIHFSGIEFGKKGEKNHKSTSENDWKTLLKNLPKDKKIIIINESPFPVEDSIRGFKIFSSVNWIVTFCYWQQM